MIVQHNIEALFASNQYGITRKKLQKNTEKLSTGYKINRSADNAAGLSISEKMRSQIRGLNQASNNIENGISLVKVVDGAFNEVHSMLHRQRELLVQAANDTNTAEDRADIELELKQLTDEIDTVFKNTEFNTLKVFKGTDTVVSGPTVSLDTHHDENEQVVPSIIKKEVLWLTASEAAYADSHGADNPEKDVEEQVDVSWTYKTTSEESEIDTDENNHSTFLVKEVTTLDSVQTTTTTGTEISYKKIDDPQYMALRSPGDMVGSNGYINVQTVKGGLELSCAMSRLGVQFKDTGAAGSPITKLDLYGDSSVSKNTTISADKKTATTDYELATGLIISQKIELSSGVNADDTYKISYSVTNNSGKDYDLSLRLAFDTMNTSTTSAKNQASYTLETDYAKIQISSADGAMATGHSSALTDIGEIYSKWDNDVTPGVEVPRHTGVGNWWENMSVGDGSSGEIGSITYGPVELKKTPYEKTTEIAKKIKHETDSEITTTESEIIPEYLDIQAGANTLQNIPIRLYNLSAEKLGISTGIKKGISAFNGSKSLTNMDSAIEKISSIRSYYGVMNNRLEHAYDADKNTAENLQNAESRIRDVDMAEEMVEFSKNNIVQQAAQSMLSQVNKNPEAILSLLQ